MSAGRFGKHLSEAPDNSAFDVHRFAYAREALVSLGALAPLHQRYAIRRGMRALGMDGDPPGLDELALAAEAPTPPLMDLGPCLEGERLCAWAVSQYLGDERYMTEDGDLDMTRALAAADHAVGPAARARRLGESKKAFETYRHAKEFHARWHRLAIGLADFAHEMAPWVPDSRLAAMPEDALRDLAVITASRHEARIRASRAVTTTPDGTRYLAETGEILTAPCRTSRQRSGG
ncbi:hypothetical protein ACFQU7_08755 [Pseudoroseomonas wenyumeiae]